MQERGKLSSLARNRRGSGNQCLWGSEIATSCNFNSIHTASYKNYIMITSPSHWLHLISWRKQRPTIVSWFVTDTIFHNQTVLSVHWDKIWLDATGSRHTHWHILIGSVIAKIFPFQKGLKQDAKFSEWPVEDQDVYTLFINGATFVLHIIIIKIVNEIESDNFSANGSVVKLVDQHGWTSRRLNIDLTETIGQTYLCELDYLQIQWFYF